MKKNCIVLTTNQNCEGIDQYLHIKEKKFDLIIIDYNSKKGESLSRKKDVDFVYESEGGYKLQNIKKLVEYKNILDDYDYLWFPDWDIQIDDNINDIFDIAKKYSFVVSQPSLSDSSFISWDVTRHIPNSEARISNFVEMMCPLFESSFLKKILFTFDINISGWGIDIMWSKVAPIKQIGIIDKIIVKHERPVASGQWKLPNNKTPDKELEEILPYIDEIISKNF